MKAVHDGPGALDYRPLFDAETLETNLFFMHRGVIEPKSGIGAHFHNQCEEMFIILDGEAQFTIDGRTSLLKGPAGAPTRLGHSHAIYNATDKPVEWINFNVGTMKGVYDAFNLEDGRVGAPLDPIPTFITMHLDRSLLKPVDHMDGGTGTVQYRRALDPDRFLHHMVVCRPPALARGNHDRSRVEAGHDRDLLCDGGRRQRDHRLRDGPDPSWRCYPGAAEREAVLCQFRQRTAGIDGLRHRQRHGRKQALMESKRSSTRLNSSARAIGLTLSVPHFRDQQTMPDGDATGYSTCLEFNPLRARSSRSPQLCRSESYATLITACFCWLPGLGGLLYGVDVGIIGGALPYLEATSGLNASQLSIIVAAVLLGSVISTLFAGLLADWLGRKPLMVISGAIFVLSIPVIALSHGFVPLFFGRLLQGVSGGLVGIVVPLYLAECLSAQDRGKGTGAFQWLLTLGIFSAALIGIYYSYRVAAIDRLPLAGGSVRRQGPGMAAHLLDVDAAGHSVCRRAACSLQSRLVGFSGAGARSWPRNALLRSRSPEQAALELRRDGADVALRAKQVLRQKRDEGFAAAAKICSAVPACLRHSLLQHGDGNQLHYRIQHRHPVAERACRTCTRTGDMCCSPW